MAAVLKMIVVVLIGCNSAHISDEQQTLYVASHGIDFNNSICSKQAPCGTLHAAVEIRETILNKSTNVEVIITGFNLTKNEFPCQRIWMSIILTFDNVNEDEMHDWISSCVNINGQSIIEATNVPVNVVINNLYLSNHYFHWTNLFFAHNGEIILNNCIIKNIELIMGTHYVDSFIKAVDVKIYNSIFSNITVPYKPFSHGPAFIYAQDVIIFINNTVSNLNLASHFIFSLYRINGAIDFSRFDDIYLFGDHNWDPAIQPYIIYTGAARADNRYADNRNFLSINNSSFTNIKKGAILFLGEYCKNTVFMTNIEITTSHRNVSDNTMSALILVQLTGELILNNVTLNYQWGDIKSVCTVASYQQFIPLILPQCDLPVAFLHNSGFVRMDQIFITNDITEEKLIRFREHAIKNSSVILSDPNNATIDFTEFHNPSSWGYTPRSIFYNHGKIEIENMVIYGVLLSDTVLNNTGIASLINFKLLRPDYYFENEGFNLRLMSVAIVHSGLYTSRDSTGGSLFVTDTVISGAMDYGVYVSGGDVQIRNTNISSILQAIAAYHSVSVKIIQCHISNIGHADIHWNNQHRIKWSKNKNVHLENVQEIWFEDNKLQGYPGNGYILIRNSNEYKETMVEITNNEFLNGEIPIDLIEVEYYARLESFIKLEGFIQSFIRRNKFRTTSPIPVWWPLRHVSTKIKTDPVYLYISGFIDGNYFVTDEMLTHCLTDNTFDGYGIRLVGAYLGSCVHRELSINNDTSCWKEPGVIFSDVTDSNYGDTFIVRDVDISLFKILDHSSIILDHSHILTNFTSNNNNSQLYNPFDLTQYWSGNVYLNPLDGTISLLDVMIDDKVEIEFYAECINSCAQLYNGSINLIHQLHLNCINGSWSNSSEIIKISESSDAINGALPEKLIINSSGKFSPGGAVDVYATLLDSYDNVFYDWDEAITIRFSSSDFDFETALAINCFDYNSTCSTQLYIQNAKIDSLGKTYSIDTAVVGNNLFTNNFNVTPIECRSGFGVNSQSSQCEECSVGKFSIEPSLLSCADCPEKLIGIKCLGGDKIEIERNHWVGFNFGNSDIVSQYCPSNYCSQKANELYLNMLTSNQLCALNRDKDSLLCGKCNQNFSEMYGSANCGECKGNAYWLWCLIVIASILLTTLILFNTSITVNQTGEYKTYGIANCIKTCRRTFHINDKAKEFLLIGLSKPILYYYQSVAFMLLNGGTFVQLSGMAELFNFQFDFGETDSREVSGICLTQNLNAKWEIILRLIVPVVCLITLGIFCTIHKATKKNILGRKPLFGKALIKLLLITIGTICAVCFKLIACREVGDTTVHFYFGSDTCYDDIWYISLTMLLLFIGLFTGFFVKIYSDRKNDKCDMLKSDEYVFQSLVKSYKIKCYWYWEWLVFSRRIIVALICLSSEDQKWRNALFIIIGIYLLIHSFCNPFKIEAINQLETICLFCLMSVLYILNDGSNDHFLNGLLLLPLVFMIAKLGYIAGPYNPGRLPAVASSNMSPKFTATDSDTDVEYLNQQQTNVVSQRALDFDDSDGERSIETEKERNVMIELVPNNKEKIKESVFDRQISALAESVSSQ